MRIDIDFCQKSDVSLDRKSTRPNSSHGYISYAVFCLKKKKTFGRGAFPNSTTTFIDCPGPDSTSPAPYDLLYPLGLGHQSADAPRVNSRRYPPTHFT